MKVIAELLIIFSVLTSGCKGTIVTCHESVESKVCFSVNRTEDYDYTNAAKFPTLVNTTLIVHDIIKVDDEQQTVTLAMQVILKWYDQRLSVDRSKEDIDK